MLFKSGKLSPQETGAPTASVRCCIGPEVCKYGILEPRNLGRKIDCLSFTKPFPHKVKIAISGCSMCCTEPYVRDIGIIATRKGWKILFGGNAGGKPRIADLITVTPRENTALTLIERMLNFYLDNASKKQRTARFVESIGIDVIRKNILKDFKRF